MSVLADKVAIITGASSGIGQATALALAQRNCKVVLAARREDRLQQLKEQIVNAGSRALAIACDVADRAQVQQMVQRATDTFGRIDILINNAGVMPLSPMAKCRIDDWDYQIDINVKGLLYCIGYVLPGMLQQKTGHIVNISSVAGRIILPTAAVYCGTKFAVHAISEGLRSEMADLARENGTRIRVTVVAPGMVSTELANSILDEETREGMKKFHSSINDPLTSEDIAGSILYALQAPPHVDVNEILVRPTSQVR